MDRLSATELKVLNNLSNVHNPAVDLGTLVDQRTVEFDTPVKWVAASKVLTISGAVKHGETVSISNPALGHSRDKYEFLATVSQEVSEVGNIPIDIESYTAKAAVVLTLAVQPTAGDTTTIGSKIYTWVPVGTDTADGEISIGADLAEAKLNFVDAVLGEDEFNLPHPLVSASVFLANACTITALVGGTAGNSIASTENFTSGSNSFAATTLLLGTDCTAPNGVTALVAAITAEDTQGVGAADGTGDTVVLTADEAGVVGNDITIAETMATGAFAGAATKLSGGVDGHEVWDGRLMADDTYLYVYMGTDWRRIALGSAY